MQGENVRNFIFIKLICK